MTAFRRVIMPARTVCNLGSLLSTSEAPAMYKGDQNPRGLGNRRSHRIQGPEMEPGLRVTGKRFWPGRVGSRVSVSDPVFDPVLSFNMRVYRGVVSIE